MSTNLQEIGRGERFEFGANWSKFLASISDERIAAAEDSLRAMLGDLTGKRFLDIGSGSGLFSLAAHRLGATVHSFDFDPKSVACTKELRRRYGSEATWTIAEASALDLEYVRSLGTFDVVYSWGVLHHTGEMWKGLEHAGFAVAPEGKLFVAIYNDQGYKSRYWHFVKKIYVSRIILRPLIIAIHILPLWSGVILDLLRGKIRPGLRGMKLWTDLIDWLGGYPFEVATPEAVFEFFHQRGFALEKLITRQNLGCNELVFQRRILSL